MSTSPCININSSSLAELVDRGLTIFHENNVFSKVHYRVFDLWRHWWSHDSREWFFSRCTPKFRARWDWITELHTFATLFRPRHVTGGTSGSSRLSSMCAWQAGLRDFLGSKDLLVLRPLRHEPTAQYYLPSDSSQRLPSVHETETGFRIRPEAPDWPSPWRARGLYGMLDQCGRENYMDGAARRTLFSSWNWIDACLRCLVGANQLVAALKQAARWLLPSHSRCEIPLPISSAEALGFEPSWIRRNGQTKYISVSRAVVYCWTINYRSAFVHFYCLLFRLCPFSSSKWKFSRRKFNFFRSQIQYNLILCVLFKRLHSPNILVQRA